MTHRPDIEGLRAVSVILVVIYHYFPWLMPGGYIGVDVFFVISGYLVTQSILDHASRTYSLTSWLLDFWSRRARRLLPNALLVMVAASAFGVAWLSDFSIKKLGSDVFWSATYSVNWLFILRAIDYLQWDETRGSVLLHFWSLAIEEQFYLAWPAVLYVALRNRLIQQRLRASQICAALLVLSLAYSLWLSSSQLTLAFFSSPSRAWELLCGAWLALRARESGTASPSMAGWSRALAFVGLAVIPTCGLMFSDDTVHPGPLTLLPVLAAGIVIRFAPALANSRAMGWLANRPMQIVGSRSYSIYLWHWPVLVLGKPMLPAWLPGRQFLLLLLSLVLAEAAWRYVETPARFRWGQGLSARRIVAIAAVASFAVAMTGLALRAAGSTSSRELVGLRPRPSAAVMPELRKISEDLPSIYKSGCHLPLEGLDNGDCLYGDPNGREAAVLFGDSHAAQWFPALDIVARDRTTRLHAWTKSGCPSADVSVWNAVAKGVYLQCDVWRKRLFQRIETLRPSTVILSNLIDESMVLVDPQSGKPLRGREAAAAFADGLARTIGRLKKTGAIVVVVRDIPRPRPDILDCLYATATPDTCALTRAEATAPQPVDVLAAQRGGAVVWDFTDAICTGAVCPVIAREPQQVVYRDSNHLTASFVMRLAPEVASRWSRLPNGSARQDHGR